ncbi:sigma-54-dependent Fis family transcriptional regulator [bacterium]|nr:sigma-54-dependent Fis family transcriptional regulator [bacterium]
MGEAITHPFRVQISDKMQLIGRSESFQQLIESIRQVAPTTITVLITGESGTGKEIIARAIHELSPRKAKPLITVNCGAIPEGILESELFGHEKGSFTGAVDMRRGYFELADSGTLFLDEIGEMPLTTQVKLLRALDSQEFMRVGGNRIQHVNIRVLAATNRDLELAVRRNEFRKDLFFRLNAVKIHIPPLRERRPDIHPLAEFFAEETSRQNAIRFQGFTEEAFQVLENHSWPGNIRELRHVIERAIILEAGQMIDGTAMKKHIQEDSRLENALPVLLHKSADQSERELIYRALVDIRMALEDLRRLVIGAFPVQISGEDIGPGFEGGSASREENRVLEHEDLSIKNAEKKQIEKALEQFKHNRRKAAKALGMGERTLYRKLKEFGLENH